MAAQAVSDSFNPHSPLLANELHVPPDLVAVDACFNPHSPLLANELRRSGWGESSSPPVSIHIRHCWRMNFDYASQTFVFNGVFQSTFAIAGE